MTGAGLAWWDFGTDLGEEIIGLLSIVPFSLMEVTYTVEFAMYPLSSCLFSG